MNKYQVDVPGGQVGVIGDGAQIDELHLHAPPPSKALSLHQLRRPPGDFTGREAELAQPCNAL